MTDSSKMYYSSRFQVAVSLFLLTIATAEKSTPTYDWTDETGKTVMCQKCPPGTYVAIHCTSRSDTVCHACPEEHYTQYWNYLDKCRFCNVICQEGEQVRHECNSTHNRVCECQPGYHRSGHYCIKDLQCNFEDAEKDFFQLRLAALRADRALRTERERERRRRRRRFWIHPITSARMIRGVYCTLHLELRRHPDKFYNYLRMNIATFDELLQRLSTRLQRQDTTMRRSICPEERLMVTLRFLATGESYSSLHFQFRLGISTVSIIVRDTCQAVWDLLKDDYMPHPTTQQWLDIADRFWQVTQFPNCAGAVDGKHIRIQKPAGSASIFYNYKKYFSVVLMAIADADYKFVAVDIGAYGRTNDSRVFKTSAMGRRLYSGDFGMPAPKPFPGTDGPPMPFVIVGDEAFQMCGNLLKPYSSRGLTYQKRIYNYRLTRARRLVECAFGILTHKWRIFTRPIQLKPEAVDDVVKASVILHNFVLSKEPLTVDTEDLESGLPSVDSTGPRSTMAVNRMRDNFAEYFISDVGRVDWQDSRI